MTSNGEKGTHIGERQPIFLNQLIHRQ